MKNGNRRTCSCVSMIDFLQNKTSIYIILTKCNWNLQVFQFWINPLVLLGHVISGELKTCDLDYQPLLPLFQYSVLKLLIRGLCTVSSRTTTCLVDSNGSTMSCMSSKMVGVLPGNLSFPGWLWAAGDGWRWDAHSCWAKPEMLNLLVSINKGDWLFGGCLSPCRITVQMESAKAFSTWSWHQQYRPFPFLALQSRVKAKWFSSDTTCTRVFPLNDVKSISSNSLHIFPWDFERVWHTKHLAFLSNYLRWTGHVTSYVTSSDMWIHMRALKPFSHIWDPAPQV